jgi:hypothetical protein
MSSFASFGFSFASFHEKGYLARADVAALGITTKLLTVD